MFHFYAKLFENRFRGCVKKITAPIIMTIFACFAHFPALKMEFKQEEWTDRPFQA